MRITVVHDDGTEATYDVEQIIIDEVEVTILSGDGNTIVVKPKQEIPAVTIRL